MKALFVVFYLLLFNVEQGTSLKLSKDEIVLCIDNTATQQQLLDYKSKLAERKIIIDYNEVKRDAGNQISFIKISVDCGDGFKGSSSKALTEKDATVGFYRIYKANVSSPFGMQSKPL
jgi:hypothetical protein